MNEAWAYDIKKEGSSRENAEIIQKRVQEKGRNILIRTCMQMVALRTQDSECLNPALREKQILSINVSKELPKDEIAGAKL